MTTVSLSSVRIGGNGSPSVQITTYPIPASVAKPGQTAATTSGGNYNKPSVPDGRKTADQTLSLRAPTPGQLGVQLVRVPLYDAAE